MRREEGLRFCERKSHTRVQISKFKRHVGAAAGRLAGQAAPEERGRLLFHRLGTLVQEQRGVPQILGWFRGTKEALSSGRRTQKASWRRWQREPGARGPVLRNSWESLGVGLPAGPLSLWLP